METHGELMQIATIMYTNCTLASTLIINLPEANVSVSTRDQSFCQFLNTKMIFIFPHVDIISLHRVDSLLTFTKYHDVNVEIASVSSFSFPSLSLFISRKSNGVVVVIRANPRFV